MSKPIMAVVGATGAQGNGVIQAILEDGKYTARALTRNPDGDKATALKQAGVEVVAADLDDVDSMNRALEGVEKAFFVTNFWEHYSPAKEVAQAKNMAEAAKKNGLKHVVWSTLEDTRLQIPLDDDRMPTLQGNYKVPHFDGKGEANKWFIENNVPTTFFYVSFYWENMIGFGMGPRRGDDGKLQFVLPLGKGKLSGVSSADVGRIAYGILQHPELIGAHVGAGGDHLTGEQMAAKMSAALGEEVRFVDVAPDVYRSFGFPGADDLGNMFQHHQIFESDVLALRDVEFSRRMYQGTKNFEQWLADKGELLKA